MVGTTYSITADSGLVVVVVPVKDQETELEITYWQGADEATKEDDGSSVFLATVIATAVLVLCILVCGYAIFKALKNRKNSANQVAPVTEVQKFEEVAQETIETKR
jgi:hypothetical protein